MFELFSDQLCAFVETIEIMSFSPNRERKNEGKVGLGAEIVL